MTTNVTTPVLYALGTRDDGLLAADHQRLRHHGDPAYAAGPARPRQGDTDRMRLLVINPNSTAAMTASIAVAAREAAGEGTSIVAVNPADTPPAIEGPLDGEACLPGLFATFDREMAATGIRRRDHRLLRRHGRAAVEDSARPCR